MQWTPPFCWKLRHCPYAAPPQALNLRELVKKYGRNIGLNVKIVRIFAYQMLRALSHMRSCNILHADIKPDNILTDASQKMVKICDFGSAMLAGDNELTPYLVSRFYRSPEVILGLKYGTQCDKHSHRYACCA